MSRTARLLLLAFLESFSVIVSERAIYFYTSGVLKFTPLQNLLVALGVGLAYFAGARFSQALSRRWSERATLLLGVGGPLAVNVALFLFPQGPALVALILVVNALHGIKWPVVESFLHAGLTPRQTVRTVGSFNMAWSSAVPLSLVFAGPIMTAMDGGIFLFSAAIGLITLPIVLTLERVPAHLEAGHPERLPQARLDVCSRLLKSSRWSMLNSYALLFLLSPLIPEVFRSLGVPLHWATGLAAVTDLMRLATFWAMRRLTRWQGSAWLSALVIPLIPAGFVLALFGPGVGWVLAGEILFGIGAGMSYYAALYYAMVLESASVGAGGEHEGLIGLGFALGPAAGLLSLALTPVVGGPLLATLLAIAPLGLLSAWRAASSLPHR